MHTTRASGSNINNPFGLKLIKGEGRRGKEKERKINIIYLFRLINTIKKSKLRDNDDPSMSLQILIFSSLQMKRILKERIIRLNLIFYFANNILYFLFF